jgi:hypothetical protein
MKLNLSKLNGNLIRGESNACCHNEFSNSLKQLIFRRHWILCQINNVDRSIKTQTLLIMWLHLTVQSLIIMKIDVAYLNLFFHKWMQTLKRTCQEANESLALYAVPCNFVTMFKTAYYLHCPLSLPYAFNTYIQKNTSFFEYGLIQRVIQWMHEEVRRNVSPLSRILVHIQSFRFWPLSHVLLENYWIDMEVLYMTNK